MLIIFHWKQKLFIEFDILPCSRSPHMHLFARVSKSPTDTGGDCLPSVEWNVLFASFNCRGLFLNTPFPHPSLYFRGRGNSCPFVAGLLRSEFSPNNPHQENDKDQKRYNHQTSFRTCCATTPENIPLRMYRKQMSLSNHTAVRCSPKEWLRPIPWRMESYSPP